MKASSVLCVLAAIGFLSLAPLRPAHSQASNLDAQKKALDIIADFANRLCQTAPLSGSDQRLELSGKAKAELNAVLKKLTELGIEAGAKYQSSSYQGVLQTDLAALLKEGTSCRLKVWEDLKDKLLPGTPATPKPSAKDKPSTKAPRVDATPPAKPKPQFSANVIPRVRFGTPVEDVKKVDIEFKLEDGGKRLVYERDFAGDSYTVNQEVRNGLASSARLSRETFYQTYGPGRTSEGNPNEVRQACSSESVDALIDRLKKRLGPDMERIKAANSQFRDPSGNCEHAGTRTVSGAVWRFDDGGRAILRVEYEVGRMQNCAHSSSNEFRQNICSIELCAAAPARPACFRIPGVDLD